MHKSEIVEALGHKFDEDMDVTELVAHSVEFRSKIAQDKPRMQHLVQYLTKQGKLTAGKQASYIE